MHSKKVKALLSVLLVLCVFLPSFSSLSSAADINASAFSSANAEFVTMYYLGSGGVIEARYDSGYSDLISSFPSTFTIPYEYNDANRKAIFITLDITFTDDKKFYNTDYRLQFNTSATCNVYSYIMNLPDTYKNGLVTSDVVLSQTALAYTAAYLGRDVGDVYRYPVTMNNDIVNRFNSEFGSSFTDNITMGYAVSDSINKFTCDFHIPQNQTMLYYPKLNASMELLDATPAPRTLRICLYLYQSSGTQTSLKISDLTLIPINGTEQYYQDEIFQNDVIGSDQEGSESGLKGIISFLKNLPSRILDGIKSLFIPADDWMQTQVNDMSLYLEEHLGFIWQFLTFIEDFIERLIGSVSTSNISEIQSAAASSYLYFPSVKIYLSADPPDGQSFILSDVFTQFGTEMTNDLSSYSEFILIPDNSQPGEESGYYFRFTFLDYAPFSVIYTTYIAFSYALLTLLFVWHWYTRGRRIIGAH